MCCGEGKIIDWLNTFPNQLQVNTYDTQSGIELVIQRIQGGRYTGTATEDRYRLEEN